MGTGSFPRVKSGRGVTLTPHPLLMHSSAVGRGRASRPDHDQQHCYHHAPTVKPELYLYYPYGPYGLYSAQCLYKGALYLYLWSWKSRAIPLLPLWAVRPVQSLSACTRVHFTFTFGHERVELYLYYPYGPYGLYRASVPVQGCTYTKIFWRYFYKINHSLIIIQSFESWGWERNTFSLYYTLHSVPIRTARMPSGRNLRTAV